MIAVKRLQSLFWILLVAMGALGAYLVSLRAATERNALHAAERQIYRARADVRYLETEMAARASMRQLEQWNNDDFRYSAPQAAQYLDGERALASLDRIQPNGPVYVAPPVMTAMVESPADAPAAAAPATPAPAPVREDLSLVRTAKAAEPAPRARPAVAGTIPAPSATAKRAERMAMLDAKLLDDRTLSDIGAQAAAERRKSPR
jgi:hypothetical protein